MKDCNDQTACMGRREFLVKAGLVTGGVVLTVSSLGGTAVRASFEDVTIDVGADSALAKVGGSQIVGSTAGKLIVIHSEDDRYLAFSAKCTHRAALLDYDHAAKKLTCHKHGSVFEGTTGAAVHGPADHPLKSYPAKSVESKVVVKVT